MYKATVHSALLDHAARSRPRMFGWHGALNQGTDCRDRGHRGASFLRQPSRTVVGAAVCPRRKAGILVDEQFGDANLEGRAPKQRLFDLMPRRKKRPGRNSTSNTARIFGQVTSRCTIPPFVMQDGYLLRVKPRSLPLPRTEPGQHAFVTLPNSTTKLSISKKSRAGLPTVPGACAGCLR
jgi:hypothetical protein